VDRIAVGDDSEVVIGYGLPEPLLPPRPGRERAVVLTQPGAVTTAAFVSRLLGAPAYVLPDREAAKTWETVGKVYEWLEKQNLTRDDTIVGVGGGTVTDVAGFVAATWLRGVEVVHVPTTLLGAVDAAVGGKSGFNVGGKNMVGAFHHPSRVIIDIDQLSQLPRELWLEGVAEIIKVGLIGDPDLIELFVRHGENAPLPEIVARAVQVKASVVNEDFRERDRRAILNFGHTVGHAIEMASGLPHGMALGVGMVTAGAISAHRYEFSNLWLRDLIQSVGLPVAAPAVDLEEVRALIALDKKRTAEGPRMVLLRGVGEPVVEVVTEEEIMLGLAAIGLS
jgi:3-dehydroquinate synthase